MFATPSPSYLYCQGGSEKVVFSFRPHPYVVPSPHFTTPNRYHLPPPTPYETISPSLLYYCPYPTPPPFILFHLITFLPTMYLHIIPHLHFTSHLHVIRLFHGQLNYVFFSPIQHNNLKHILQTTENEFSKSERGFCY